MIIGISDINLSDVPIFLRFFTSTPAAEQRLYVFDVFPTPPIKAGLYRMEYTEQCPESDS